MLIARWILLLAGLGICTSVALYVWTGNPAYWRLARRIFTTAAAAAIIFFAILMLERLAI
jgi:hypothetical protein